MGADFLQLFDRRSAEIIMGSDADDLCAFVDLKTKVDGPLTWRGYWDSNKESWVDFPLLTPASARLERLLKEHTLNEIKETLIHDLCASAASLSLDYWGCWSEAFPVGGAPNAITWESFAASIYAVGATSSNCCYVLTLQNVESILSSLETHRSQLTIMNDADVARLHSWFEFCLKHDQFSILYHIDC